MTRKSRSSKLLGHQLTVPITWVDDHGNGVGDADGRTVAVAGALPGDVVVASIHWASPVSPWARGSVVRLVTPSDRRVPNPCAHAPRCVGCPLRALDGNAQLVEKKRRVERALAAAGLPWAVPDVTPAPTTEGYRARAKYVVQRNAHGVTLGAYAPGSHDVFASQACNVVHPLINQALAALLPLLADAPTLPRYVLARTNGRGVLGTLVVQQAGTAEVKTLAQAWMTASAVVAGVTEHHQPGAGDAILSRDEQATTPLCGASALPEVLAGVPVSVGTEAFTQLHPGAAAAMLETAAQLLSPLGGLNILDAYCGLGAFAFALKGAATVVGVDDNGPAIAAAQQAARDAGLGHLRFEVGDASGWLARSGEMDAVVVDPPRKGLSPEGLAGLLAGRPKKVLYVACEPHSLARDGAALVASGYQLSRLVAVDLFPQTPEVEVLALLVRGD